MKSFFHILCLCLTIYLPLITYANLADEVIFKHPAPENIANDELWLTNMWDTHNARQIYKHTHWIFELAVQRDGPYIVIVANHDKPTFDFDAYLIDRNTKNDAAHNLTQSRYGEVRNIDISQRGDIIFTNSAIKPNPEKPIGIYLIPNQELKKPFPKVELLLDMEAQHAAWSPDGNRIAFDVSGEGIYVYSVYPRGALHHINGYGYLPAFSPDGKYLTFAQRFNLRVNAINIISLETLRHLKIIPFEAESCFSDLKWGRDGRSVICTVCGDGRTYHTYLTPLDGSPRIEIMTIDNVGVSMFDWANAAYSVEPANKLTTCWGAFKKFR